MDDLSPGLVFVVLQVKGDELLVSKGKPGWTSITDVLPLAWGVLHFTELIEKNPDNHELYNDRALYWYNYSNFKLALRDYSRSLTIEPQDLEADKQLKNRNTITTA